MGIKLKLLKCFDKIINDNPEYYYLRIYNGNFPKHSNADPKSAKLNWNEALKINPNSNISKFLLAQLHFTVPVLFSSWNQMK